MEKLWAKNIWFPDGNFKKINRIYISSQIQSE